MRRPLRILLAASLLTSLSVSIAVGCGDDDDAADPSGDGTGAEGGERVHGLTKAQRDEVLATIGDERITVGEFAEELASKGAYIRTRYNSPERRREFLDQMIRFELLAQEAERRGYDDLPEVSRTRKQMMIRRFLEERFEQGGPDAIPEEDVRRFYEAQRSEYHTPEQVRASHIRFRDRRAAERVLRELQAAPADLRLYRRLAEQHNTDPATQEHFGDLRFFARPGEDAEAGRSEDDPPVPDEVREAAFAIERIGGMAPDVVRSADGYHIVKLTGRRAAMHRSFEEAERSIRARLHRERRENAIEELLNELRAEADVQESFENLGEVRIELPEGDVPTVTSPELQRRGATRP